MNITNILQLKSKFIALWESGNIGDALDVGDFILNQYQEHVLLNTKKYADDLFDIGFVNDEVGRLEKAEKLYMESTKVIKRLCGKSLNYTFRINNLAILYMNTERPAEALRLFRECYKLRLFLLGEKHALSIESLRNLGHAYYNNKKYDKALLHLTLLKEQYRRIDKAAIDNINYIGYIYEKTKNYPKAFHFLGEGLGLTGRLYGMHSGQYLGDLHYIAALYETIGDQNKANEHLEKFLKISEKAYGKNQKYLLAYWDKKYEYEPFEDNEDKFIESRIKIIEISRKILGTNHIFIAESLVSAAILFKESKRYKKAIAYLNEALEIKRQLIGEDNIDFLKDLVLLSSIYYEDNQFGKSVDMVACVVDILEKNQELMDECLTEMTKAFTGVKKLKSKAEFNKNKKKFLELYHAIMADELPDDFDWHIFDDYEE